MRVCHVPPPPSPPSGTPTVQHGKVYAFYIPFLLLDSSLIIPPHLDGLANLIFCILYYLLRANTQHCGCYNRILGHGVNRGRHPSIGVTNVNSSRLSSSSE